MDHIRILRRAFEITRVYRALWVFGILLALTTARGSGSNGGGQASGDSQAFRNLFSGRFPNFNFPNLFIPPQIANTLIAVGVAAVCLVLLIAIVFAVLRYISETALIRMVDGYETSGEKVSVGTGFRMGWSRASFRLWLVDLLFALAFLVVLIVLALIVAAPLLLWLTHNNTVGVVGTVITVGLAVLSILLLIVAAVLVSLWLQIIRRAIVLEGLGVFDGIRRGWEIIIRRLGDVIIMGLILFGLGLAYAILMIPVVLLLLVIGLVAGGLPALLAGAITNIFVHGNLPQIIAATVGVPIFLAVLAIPLAFIGGLVQTFYSSTWTLTYRELVALEAVQPPAVTPPAAPDLPGPEPAAG